MRDRFCQEITKNGKYPQISGGGFFKLLNAVTYYKQRKSRSEAAL